MFQVPETEGVSDPYVIDLETDEHEAAENCSSNEMRTNLWRHLPETRSRAPET